MAELSEELVAEAFASPFVEDAFCRERLGGGKAEMETVRRYLALPIAARPELSVFFDREYYVWKYPDIAVAGVDPLAHFLRWGIAEKRRPHPLIDLGHMLAADPEALPDPPSDTALLAALAGDAVDPGPYFSLSYYRSQLDGEDPAEGGLLRHFLERGLLRGLRPVPAFDPLGCYRWLPGKGFDVRSALRAFEASGGAPPGAAAAPPEEAQTRALVHRQAMAAALHRRRCPLDFSFTGEPALSVVVVAHDRFALTLRVLTSLRASTPLAMELIVIDSGSTDEIRNLGRYVHGAALLRFEQNVGFVRGANAGLELASGEAVLFLNNDAAVQQGAVEAALRRLASAPDIGVVGAKVVRTHGLLQEAGGIVWRNGWTVGYLRDQQPEVPEANFVRDVDFVSGTFLLARAEPLRALEGFDAAYIPAYYEDVDLCERFRAAGWRVVYDPAVVVEHLEYGSSAADAVHERIAVAQKVFFARHRDRLRGRYASDARAQLFARSTATPRGRVLLIEDRLPLRRYGSGFVRSNDIVASMARLGFFVTVYGVSRDAIEPAAACGDFPDTVEVVHDHALADLPVFLKQRRGYYDTIWIARTHNLDLLRPLLEAGGVDVLGGVDVVLDTEAIAARREVARREVLGIGERFDLAEALGDEFRNAEFCQTLVAVSESEKADLEALGFSGVEVLGHRRELAPTPRGWREREGLLFVGALPTMDAPNYDGLAWFVDEVLPLLAERLGSAARLTVAGQVGDGVEMERFARHQRVALCGEVADLTPLYGSHRVFIAPTRFAAGIPYKVHEAASFGLPVVATELLRGQLGWENGRDLLAAPAADPKAFAGRVLQLYLSDEEWQKIREGATRRVSHDCNTAGWEATLLRILQKPRRRG